MKVFMFSSYPRISFYGTPNGHSPRKQQQFGNIMYDKRVVRGNTFELRQMAQDDLKLNRAATERDNSSTLQKLSAENHEQNQRIIKARLRQSKHNKSPRPQNGSLTVDSKSEGSLTPRSNASAETQASQTPNATNHASEASSNDVLVNKFVEQTIAEAVEELERESAQPSIKPSQQTNTAQSIPKPNEAMRDSAENRFASQVVEASMKEAVVESSKANFDDEASYSTHQHLKQDTSHLGMMQSLANELVTELVEKSLTHLQGHDLQSDISDLLNNVVFTMAMQIVETDMQKRFLTEKTGRSILKTIDRFQDTKK